MRLARGVVVVAITVFIVFKTVGLFGEIQSVKDGDATDYYSSFRAPEAA